MTVRVVPTRADALSFPRVVPTVCRLVVAMRKPRHQRRGAKHRKVQSPPENVDLRVVAKSCQYVGSPYHKDGPSFAGQGVPPRPDASICPAALNNSKSQIETWLRTGIVNGHTGVWEDGYPRYVWYRKNGIVYEARQGSPGSGQYHGYPLAPQENVRCLP